MMPHRKQIQVIVTIGPSSRSEADLCRIKDKGVDFVRVNMSHSNIDDLRYFVGLAKKVDIPFIIDTEGSQIRTGELLTDSIELEEGEDVRIYEKQIVGDRSKICLKPDGVVGQLETGDIIHVDFDTLTLSVSDVSTLPQGYVVAKTITGGRLGRNKAVVIDSALNKKINLPPLSQKDYRSIRLGLSEGIGHIAASFMRSGESVDEVRRATQNTMKIISKVECVDALENLDDIINKSDAILIDRGDLSKEIPIEKIPFAQKIIISRARKRGIDVFVATNLLESMIENRKPTRAEVHDVIATVADGATGLTLSAETAIGKHPLACINILNKLIKHSELWLENAGEPQGKQDHFVQCLEESNYLLDPRASSAIVPPHGGVLINRVLSRELDRAYVASLPRIPIDETKQMDVEQIAIGTYSPLQGFMGKGDLLAVLDTMRLESGVVWPLPILLDVSDEESEKVAVGDDVALVADGNDVVAVLHLEEKYRVDREAMAKKIYATDSTEHPGVRLVQNMKPVFLAGEIDLLKRMASDCKGYEMTPRQARRVFEERGWAKVVGFHTRNVIHRSHEFIQMKALGDENCDGLFVHPIIGKKKAGDFHAKYVLQAYELMKKDFYPREKIVFAAFATYARYAGPRESLFTALCRKNFGCSHFIVGRDHTGVGDFYHPKASHTIFDRFPDLGITPIKFENVFYSKELGGYVHVKEAPGHEENDKLHISGTQARKMLEKGEMPPEWFMRPEISRLIIDAVRNGEEVFVK